MAGSRYRRWPRRVSAPPRRLDIHRGTSWRRRLQLIELVHAIEKLEHTTGLVLVKPRQGEADIDDHILADLDRRDVLQADVLRDPAKVDFPHEDVVLAVSRDDLARNPETHRCTFSVAGRCL